MGYYIATPDRVSIRLELAKQTNTAQRHWFQESSEQMELERGLLDPKEGEKLCRISPET